MTIEFNCPHCNKSLSTSDEKAGCQATCPGCGTVIHIPPGVDHIAGTAAAGDEQFKAAEQFANTAQGVRPSDADSKDTTKPCPICGESIHAAAIYCRHCGNVLNPAGSLRKRQRPRRMTRPFPPADVVIEAWQLFVDNVGLSIGSFAVLLLMIGLIAAVPYGPLYLSESLFDQGNGAGATAALLMSVVLYLTAIFVITDLLSGYLVVQIKMARGQTAELSDLFGGGRFVTRLLYNSILFAIAAAFGMTFIIPGILIAIVFFPFAHVLVDEDPPGIDCFRRARQLTYGNWPSIVIVFFVSMLAVIIGMTACVVGMIAAIPFINLLIAVAYDWMTCQTPLKTLEQEAESRSSWPTILRSTIGRTAH